MKLMSTPLLKSSHWDTQSKIRSIPMPTHKNHVYFAPHTETEYFEIPTKKPTQFRSLHWSPVDFDLHYKIKSIWTPRHQNQVNFDAYTKPRSTSTPTPKPSSFWALHWNEVNFDSQHKPSQFRCKQKKTDRFRSLHKNKSISIPILKPR